MSSRWVNPVTGYVEIDPVKFIRVFDAFKDALAAKFDKTSTDPINAWARRARKITTGQAVGKRCLQIQPEKAELLNETLTSLHENLGVGQLLYNSNTDIRLVPEGWDKTMTQMNRNLELEKLDNLVQRCKANLQQRQSQSSQSNQEPDASGTTQAANSATVHSPPGFQYRKKWLEAFDKVKRRVDGLTNQLESDPHIRPLVDKIRHHRFDRFIWPAVQYRLGTPTMARETDYLDDVNWTTVHTENDVRAEITSALSKNQFVLMHDDAGMGKTAFSWMLFEHLLDVNTSHPYVIRLEGAWPRSTDETKTPLRLMDVVLEELLGKRLVGRRIHGSDANSDTLEVFREALKEKNLFILLDGFDQMTEGDRAVAFEEIEKTVKFQSEIPNCHWLVSGRTFAFRDEKLTTIIRDRDVLRFRLERFDSVRQDEYFKDLEQDAFFLQQEDEAKRPPLNYMCSTWRKDDDSNDLGIPLHLAEIRRVIEDYLSTNMATRNQKTLGEIHSSSDLHARVSDVYLERVVKPTLNSPKMQDIPANPSTKIEVLRQVCSCFAIQMLFDCNYNASIDNGGTDLVAYKGVENHQVVKTFIARSKRRYEQLAKTPRSYWDWAVDLLEKIEVTHRGDVDTFKPECRAFRDLKAMEWYAAYYLVNYSIEADWEERIDDSKRPKAKPWQGDERWTRCWQLAMEMPIGYYNEDRLQTAIAKVLGSPPTGERRSCQWMWIAWVNRLEQDQAALKKKLQPLRHNQDVIQEFRKPFQELIAAQNPTALTLQYSAERDAPDLELKTPNQTEKGWYRRIPDVGDWTKFRRDTSDLITISPFWMRKFVVTVKEYHLFDPGHCHRLLRLREDDLPVTEVDWFSATMFCYWLGPSYHLPSEAQWETACRANQLTDGVILRETEFWFGNKEADAEKHAWIVGNSKARPHTLEESKAEKEHENRFGLYDMSGNVWEWCSDWYVQNVKGVARDPVGPIEGSDRVDRGGCWSSVAADCRSAFRGKRSPSIIGSGLGFRVAFS
jgi:hypothetical protein